MPDNDAVKLDLTLSEFRIIKDIIYQPDGHFIPGILGIDNSDFLGPYTIEAVKSVADTLKEIIKEA